MPVLASLNEIIDREKEAREAAYVIRRQQCERCEPVRIGQLSPAQLELNRLNSREQSLAEWRRKAVEFAHGWRAAWRDSGFDSPAVTAAADELVKAVEAERAKVNLEMMEVISKGGE